MALAVNAGVLGEEADDVEVALVGDLMEESVALGIGERDEVEVRVGVEVFVELVDFAVGEENFDNFALLVQAGLLLHWDLSTSIFIIKRTKHTIHANSIKLHHSLMWYFCCWCTLSSPRRSTL